MNLRINGEDREIVEGVSLEELVALLELTPERIAIELNQKVVRRAEWPSTMLREHDQLEIVHFVGGGSAGARAGGRTRSFVSAFCVSSSSISPDVFR